MFKFEFPKNCFFEFKNLSIDDIKIVNNTHIRIKNKYMMFQARIFADIIYLYITKNMISKKVFTYEDILSQLGSFFFTPVVDKCMWEIFPNIYDINGKIMNENEYIYNLFINEIHYCHKAELDRVYFYIDNTAYYVEPIYIRGVLYFNKKELIKHNLHIKGREEISEFFNICDENNLYKFLRIEKLYNVNIGIIDYENDLYFYYNNEWIKYINCGVFQDVLYHLDDIKHRMKIADDYKHKKKCFMDEYKRLCGEYGIQFELDYDTITLVAYNIGEQLAIEELHD